MIPSHSPQIGGNENRGKCWNEMGVDSFGFHSMTFFLIIKTKEPYPIPP